MSIKRIVRQPRTRNIIAYDLEWYPESYNLRVVGVYDEANHYRHYETIEQFVDSELIPTNKGKWFYAHAGGLADINFVLDYLIDNKAFQVEALFSGSSAFIVTVRREDLEWIFVDSYWLLRASLAKIGDTLGFPKLDCAFDAPIDELITYNERDCELLYKAVKAFEDELLSMGGELQMTIASCAMNLFKRQYLSRTITTSNGINEIAHNAYYASRVEMFTRHGTNLLYYDINSSFPDSMTRPLPGNYIKQSRQLDITKLCIADVMISIPEMYFPPLPTRIDGRIFFPTGCWRGWYCGEDLRLLMSVGGQVLEVYDVHYFEENYDLARYAQDIYKKKELADKDPFKRQTYKLLLNSLYGKFAEKGDRKRVHIGPNEKTWARIQQELELWRLGGEVDEKPWERIQPGVWSESTHDTVKHAHVPIPVYVTAYSRSLLYKYMSQCEPFWYCDTDGYACLPVDEQLAINVDKADEDGELHQIAMEILEEKELTRSIGPYIGTKLGELKLEKVVGEAVFMAPKFYRMDKYIKAKGFPRLTLEEFNLLCGGEKITIQRMKRVKEALRKGNTTPCDIHMEKGLRTIVAKRRMYKDGTSRPWNICELMAIFSK